MIDDDKYMQMAINLAILAQNEGEVPIGALIIDEESEEIIATGYNCPISTHDPSAHAEMVVLRKAANALENYRLRPNLRLYVTLEPCTMCAGAISFARIKTVVFGAYDVKGGAILNGIRFFESKTCHHKPQIIDGVKENECKMLLKNFFALKRGKKS